MNLDNKEEKRKQSNIENLKDYSFLIMQFECGLCGDEKQISVSFDYEGAEIMYEDGWRNPTGNLTYCPRCAQKHKIK